LTDNGQPKSFFDSFRGSALSSLPALSMVTFLLAAIKVFRASGMETSTTVAIVSTADVVALLKGVVLTLLPGAIAAAIAASIWWWAESLPGGAGQGDALSGGNLAFAWGMVGMGFFTVPWPIFLAFFLPMLGTTVPLLDHRLRGRAPKRAAGLVRLLRTSALGVGAFSLAYAAAWSAKGDTSSNWFWTILLVSFLALFFGLYRPVDKLLQKWDPDKHAPRVRRILRLFGAGAAAIMIAFLSLSQTVWLPLRTIDVQSGKTIDLKTGEPLRTPFGAYILSQGKDGASLLLEDPRAVVQVGTGIIADDPQICIPAPSSARRFFLRASQILHLEQDLGSPYQICP
jgi:hypothetical protein